jgi:AbrB family looped-hinge helix DNA binding protein
MGRATTLTSKGQVTIPKVIRDELGLKPHDKIGFSVENGCARLWRYPTLEELAGSLPTLASLGIDMTVEEAIEFALEEHARELAEKMERE